MPLSQRIWQDRWCLSPLIVTRHSKQIPMPQSGPRGVLVTDRRSVETPAARMAAATLIPRGTVQEAPLMVRVSVSAILARDGQGQEPCRHNLLYNVTIRDAIGFAPKARPEI